jgi:hypothetical protein
LQTNRGIPRKSCYFFFLEVGLVGFFGLFLAAVVIGLRQHGIAAIVRILFEIICTPLQRSSIRTRTGRQEACRALQ